MAAFFSADMELKVGFFTQGLFFLNHYPKTADTKGIIIKNNDLLVPHSFFNELYFLT